MSLKKRYPEIDFLLTLHPQVGGLFKDVKRLNSFLDKQLLEEIDVFYLVGLIDFPLPEPLQRWLRGKKERALIFIDDDLGTFAAYKDLELIDHPQVHFIYAQEDPIDQLAQDFPSDRIAIFEGKPFDSEKLKQRSATFSALYSDVLYSHKIVENVVTNIFRLDQCFDGRGFFEGIPLVICGAGPSLNEAIPILKKYRDRALILAGGSAITALTRSGLKPHLAIALDPNHEEFERIQQAHYFEGPLLFAPRLHHKIFGLTGGPFGYMRTDTGGLVEHFLEQHGGLEGEVCGPDLGTQAFSVTTLAISWASQRGFSEIILAGVDLALTEGNYYAQGVNAQHQESFHALDEVIEMSGVKTLRKWVMESDCISEFAKNHPHLKITNSSKGLGFEGIEQVSLEEKVSSFKQGDFEGHIHQWIQSAPLTIDFEKLKGAMKSLKHSLEKEDEITEKILSELEKKKETGKLALYLYDFHEEIAYPALLQGIDHALEHLLIRYHPHLDVNEGKWERQKAKFQELKRQIGKFKGIFILLAVFMASCSGLEDSENEKIRKMNAIGEYIYRAHDEILFPIETPKRKLRDNYPWEDTYIGNQIRITKEFFRCKGGPANGPLTKETSQGPTYTFDCGGMRQHSLPLKEGKEFIYPALIELLNYIQEKTQKKVIVTCGHRCPTHNTYADGSKLSRTSKHMVGAEVDFYVKGLEWNPKMIVDLIQQYYREHPDFQEQGEFVQFKRWEQETNVTTLPWYNKEIFIKLFKQDEGRDLDNNHRFPYISIQLKWDRFEDKSVSYSWSSAFNNYLRY